MILFMNLKTIIEHPVLAVGITAATVLFALLAYKNSVKSRKYYRCPECGESFRTEHAEAQCCKVCGAKLIETGDKNVNDKA